MKRSENWTHPIPSIGLGKQTTRAFCYLGDILDGYGGENQKCLMKLFGSETRPLLADVEFKF